MTMISAPRFGGVSQVRFGATVTLPVEIAGNPSSAFQNAIKQAVSRIPEPILKKLNDRGFRIVICEKLGEGFPEDWKLKNLEKTFAIYKPAKFAAVFSEYSWSPTAEKPDNWVKTPLNILEGIALEEILHAVDSLPRLSGKYRGHDAQSAILLSYVRGDAKSFSDDPEFLAALKADLPLIHAQLPTDLEPKKLERAKKFWLQYVSNPMEAFAKALVSLFARPETIEARKETIVPDKNSNHLKTDWDPAIYPAIIAHLKKSVLPKLTADSQPEEPEQIWQ